MYLGKQPVDVYNAPWGDGRNVRHSHHGAPLGYNTDFIPTTAPPGNQRHSACDLSPRKSQVNGNVPYGKSPTSQLTDSSPKRLQSQNGRMSTHTSPSHDQSPKKRQFQNGFVNSNMRGSHGMSPKRRQNLNGFISTQMSPTHRLYNGSPKKVALNSGPNSPYSGSPDPQDPRTVFRYPDIQDKRVLQDRMSHNQGGNMDTTPYQDRSGYSVTNQSVKGSGYQVNNQSVKGTGYPVNNRSEKGSSYPVNSQSEKGNGYPVTNYPGKGNGYPVTNYPGKGNGYPVTNYPEKGSGNPDRNYQEKGSYEYNRSHTANRNVYDPVDTNDDVRNHQRASYPSSNTTPLRNGYDRSGSLNMENYIIKDNGNVEIDNNVNFLSSIKYNPNQVNPQWDTMDNEGSLAPTLDLRSSAPNMDTRPSAPNMDIRCGAPNKASGYNGYQTGTIDKCEDHCVKEIHPSEIWRQQSDWESIIRVQVRYTTHTHTHHTTNVKTAYYYLKPWISHYHSYLPCM